MLDPTDVSTGDVLMMYVVIFGFLFGLAFFLLKKNS